MDNKVIMPEKFYRLNDSISLEDIAEAINTNKTIVGKVVRWNSKAKHLEVDLGNKIKGIIEFDEISIYPLREKPNNYFPGIIALVGRTICVKAIKMTSSYIVLSRKSNMLEAFYQISKQEIGSTIKCVVTSIQYFAVFLDVGFGISGMIHIKDLVRSVIHSPNDIGIYTGDIIDASIINIDSDKHHINLSYKNLFEDLSLGKLNTDDLIEVIVLDAVSIDKNGYFAHVNPATPAIINPPNNNPHYEIPYGSHVLARVRNSPQGKLKLQFISFVN